MSDQANLNSFSGEFLNSDLEARYRNEMQARTAQQLRLSMAVIAALVLLFGLLDYLMIGLGGNFTRLLLLRMVVATSCLWLVGALSRDPAQVNNPLPVNLVCMLLISSLILIVPLRPETLQSQLTAMVAVSIAIYLFIPNTIPWMLALNAYLAIGFPLALRFWGGLPLESVLAAALVMVMPNAIGLLTARRLNRLQREQFASLLAMQKVNWRLQGEIDQRERLENELRLLAQTDDLTGLNNRRWFLELATQELRHSRRRSTPLAMCMLDLDHFKNINDQLGHAAGDEVLILVAKLCREELRDSDILGRYGGEEFIIALPDTDAEAARESAERLRVRIGDSALPGNPPDLSLSVTIGITEVASGETDLEPALLRADKALYAGKKSGRNQVVVESAP